MGEHLFGDDLDANLARVAHGFAGGVAGTREHLCGALAAGIILVGYLHGRSDATGPDEPVYDRVKKYRELFIQEIGGSICRDLRENGPYGPEGPSSCRILMGEASGLLLQCLE